MVVSIKWSVLVSPGHHFVLIHRLFPLTMKSPIRGAVNKVVRTVMSILLTVETST